LEGRAGGGNVGDRLDRVRDRVGGSGGGGEDAQGDFVGREGLDAGLAAVEQKADQIVIEIDRREVCGAVSHLVPSVKFRHKCGSVRTALAPILETRKRPALQGRAFALPSGSVGVGGVHSYVGSRTRTREVPVKLAT